MTEFWDWLISISIIVGLILAVWARVSRQTIGELLRDIREYISEIREEKEGQLEYYG